MRRFSGSKHQRDGFGQQPPPHEPEHLGGGVIEPLHIIDRAQHRPFRRSLRQKTQRRQCHQKRFRALPRGVTERHAERPPLRLHERIQV